MFICQINNENIKYLRTIIDTASNIVSGPRTFIFTNEGLSFESMDQGSVFVYFKVLKEFFNKYELKKDVLELRINIDDLKKVLSRSISSDELLTLNFSDSNKFGINFSKSSGQGQKRKYELALHNPDEDEEKRNISEVIKSIPLSCHMILTPGSFKDILSDVGIAGEKDAKHIIISVDSSLAKFEINKGSDSMNALVEIPVNDPTYQIKLDEDNVKASYDMEYLDKLAKLDPLSKRVELELGSDKPLRITFKISDHVDFIFVMAPLVEDEDEDTENDSYDDDDSE
jgi:proliferating cell nuclear antigen